MMRQWAIFCKKSLKKIPTILRLSACGAELVYTCCRSSRRRRPFRGMVPSWYTHWCWAGTIFTHTLVPSWYTGIPIGAEHCTVCADLVHGEARAEAKLVSCCHHTSQLQAVIFQLRSQEGVPPFPDDESDAADLWLCCGIKETSSLAWLTFWNRIKNKIK